MTECKHGNTGYCVLCNCEDEEHDAAMAAQFADEIDRLRNNADNLRQQTEDQAAQIDRLRRELADMTVERDILRRDNANMRASVHTCGPTCSMAGCVNARLRDALRAMLAQWEYDDGDVLPPVVVQARAALGEA